MRLKLAVSMGDPAGIGPEITVRALENDSVYRDSIPIVIGDLAAVRDAVKLCSSPLSINVIQSTGEAVGKPGVIDLIDLSCCPAGGWRYGEVSAAAGQAAFEFVVKAIELTQSGETDAVVTGPISKEAIHAAGHNFSGHTEILAEYTGTGSFAMLLIGGPLRVIHATTHVSLSDACRLITKERIKKVIALADYSARLLGAAKPRIAVAGLNPHSSENGLFGSEEAEHISPAIAEMRQSGVDCEGPIPPDTVFVKAAGGRYDIVVAMYHDQGHIPVKLMGFKLESGGASSLSGINCTIGLPFIRTSVDHGTAFDIAGRGVASGQSMLEAMEAAVTMTLNHRRMA